MPVTTMLPPEGFSLEVRFLVPALVACALLVLERWGLLLWPRGGRTSLALGITATRWAWPLGLLAWATTQVPDATLQLPQLWPESPRAMLDELLLATLFWGAFAAAWGLSAPRAAPPVVPWVPVPLPSPLLWLPLTLAEALAHQVAYALVRLPALTAPATWTLVGGVGVLMALPGLLAPRRDAPWPRRADVIAWTTLVGSTGLVLSTGTLLGAVLWEWGYLLFLAAIPDTPRQPAEEHGAGRADTNERVSLS